MNEKAQGLLILTVLVGVVAGAYVLAWRGKSLAVRRGASWVVAAIFAAAGLWGILAYAVPLLLEGLRDPGVSVWVSVGGALVITAICVIPWVVAAKFVASALRQRNPPSQALSESSSQTSPGERV
jgi:hypothetical protein